MSCNLDANATWGLHPAVLAAVTEFLPRLKRELLNPSSVHLGGQSAKLILDEARDAVRELVGASSGDAVIFTSGATEANNQAVLAPFISLSCAANIDRSQFAFLTSCVEHESVSDCATRIAQLGFPVRIVKPKALASFFSRADFLEQMHPSVKVASFIHGQNEIGTILPVAQIALELRALSPQVFIHCDAVQTVGRIAFSLKKLNVDALSLSGHKIGALSGVGALVVSGAATSQLSSLLLGGAQEHRNRAGTENLLGVFSLGVAARLAKQDEESGLRMLSVRSLLREILLEKIPGLVIQGECAVTGFSQSDSEPNILPNTLCITFPPNCNLRGDDLVVACDMAGIRISTGSACSSGKQEGNRTLKALGFDKHAVQASVRISCTGAEDIAELKAAAEVISRILTNSSLRPAR